MSKTKVFQICKKYINYYISITCLLVFIYSCSSTKQADDTPCKTLYWDDYKRAVVKERKSISATDTLILNEVRYLCNKITTITTKAMYDEFGMWDEVIMSENKGQSMFYWKNIKLFSDENIWFDVATSGLESVETIYPSVIVLGENNYDYLSSDSVFRNRLIEYFGNLIKSNDQKNRAFFKPFWTTINPAHWERIKDNFEK